MSQKLLDTVVVRSGFVQVIPLDTGNSLCVHAIAQARIVLKPEIVRVLEAFAEPRRVGDWIEEPGAAGEAPREAVLAAVSSLLEQRLLYAGTLEEERRRFSAVLSQWYGRDPEEARRAASRWRLNRIPQFTAPSARDLASFAPLARRLDVVLVGLCEMQIGLDVLREEARAVGIDLNLVPTFESALEVLDDAHDAVLVGPLGERHGHWHAADGHGDLWPDRYIAAARDLILRLRTRTGAPVLLHNLPVPTCSPAGLSDRSPDSLVERCRQINRGLVALAAGFPDVYVVDVDAALSFEGKRRLLDDRLMSASHLGGLGWWTLLPDIEMRAVHGVRPPLERLHELGVDDPFEFDRVVAGAQLSLLSAIFGVGRRDAVVVALDGTLWPGELARTRQPFARDVDYGRWSSHSLFLGVHEALQGLRGRGITLAGLTPGDEAAVRPAWRFPDRAPAGHVLAPDDFGVVVYGVKDVASGLAEVARRLETTAERMVFVSADAEHRAAAAAAHPGLLVFGDNPFAVRGQLLAHPALQVVRAETEGIEHPSMMVALARREQARKAAADPVGFEQGLRIHCLVRRGVEAADIDRVHELVARTAQFTTTGLVFGREDLLAVPGHPTRRVYTLSVEDRFADYGLVGVAVTAAEKIELLLLSCRVAALRLDQAFLGVVVRDLLRDHPVVRGQLFVLARNGPARGVFRAAGFRQTDPGLWEMDRAEAGALPALPSHVDLQAEGM